MPSGQLQRREFMTLLGSATMSWPLSARAQQSGKVARVGFLGSTGPAAMSLRVAAFVERLRELGWIENRTIAIEYRWAEGRSDRFSEIVAEFIRLNVDVIVTTGTPSVAVVKQATAVIPIVFVQITDPVGSGFIASLARPGGNLTGLSLQSPDIAGKRLALLREVAPTLHRVAFMGNTDQAFVLREFDEVRTSATALGFEVVKSEIRRTQDVLPAFEALKDRADALYLANEGLVDANRHRINVLALGARLPTMWTNRDPVEAGGLMSYGPSFTDHWRRVGDFVDKILRGTKPGDIPVEQPTKFDLVVNLIVAKALGIDIPHTLLSRADEVIE
jgi:putative ABC transport system substrate-binding protein